MPGGRAADVTAFFGRVGLYDSMREGDDGLVPMARPAQGDHTTGLAMVGAILGALRLAEKTGKGQVVENVAVRGGGLDSGLGLCGNRS